MEMCVENKSAQNSDTVFMGPEKASESLNIAASRFFAFECQLCKDANFRE